MLAWEVGKGFVFIYGLFYSGDLIRNGLYKMHCNFICFYFKIVVYIDSFG